VHASFSTSPPGGIIPNRGRVPGIFHCLTSCRYALLSSALWYSLRSRSISRSSVCTLPCASVRASAVACSAPNREVCLQSARHACLAILAPTRRSCITGPLTFLLRCRALSTFSMASSPIAVIWLALPDAISSRARSHHFSALGSVGSSASKSSERMTYPRLSPCPGRGSDPQWGRDPPK